MITVETPRSPYKVTLPQENDYSQAENIAFHLIHCYYMMLKAHAGLINGMH